MSQPFDRGCEVPAPAGAGEPDPSLGELWVGNPLMISQLHNLSCYERNRAYLNVGGKNFVDASTITGTDSDGDGRAIFGADLNGDGREDVVVRQVGGGPLLVFENRFPQKAWLKISLRGTESNRQGIGARLIAQVGGTRIVRELWPINTFHSQAPACVHFGLGSQTQVDELTIQWPSGKEQKLGPIPANRHVRVREGADGFDTVTPGQPFKP